MLVLFLFSLDLMISSLRLLGKDAELLIVEATRNPFTGLFIGLLVTALIQSSSTTTALTVALVASGAVTLDHAIPVIMGANVGTTITSTIVALGFISDEKEFKRAVAAGTYHDIFNILTVLILFPIEYYFGFLYTLTTTISHSFFAAGHTDVSISSTHLWPGFGFVIDFLLEISPSAYLVIFLAFALLFSSIILFRKLISKLLSGYASDKFAAFFFKTRLKSFMWGLLSTAAIRSSTVTSSLVVPIVAKKIVKLKKVIPFILGANMGTTITAFIAATLNAHSQDTISLAFVHFFFNLIGVVLFYSIPVVKNIPLQLATKLGELTQRFRLAGLLYILLTFFIVPFSLIYASEAFGAQSTQHSTTVNPTIHAVPMAKYKEEAD